MNEKLIKCLSALAGLFLMIAITLQWVSVMCFDYSFYAREYRALGTAEGIGISQEQLDEATAVLLDYTRGKRDDLNVSAAVNGIEQEVFGEREKLHMADVRALYLGAMSAGYIMLAAAAAWFVFAFIYAAKRRAARAAIIDGYIRANWIFLAIVGAIGIFAALDFTTFWTGFHRLFFTNDLWLLNPATDILIMMVPEKFFFDLVLRIVIAVLGTFAVLFIGALMWKRRLARKEMEKA